MVIQKITTTSKTEIVFPNRETGQLSSLIITNNHTSINSVSLWLTSKLGSDITPTGVLAHETEAASSNLVVLNVDTAAPTDLVFKDEVVYKSDGNVFGTCTSVNISGTPDTITFTEGLKNKVTENDPLYTGTIYYILNSIKIPETASLKLSGDEFNFDGELYKLYVKASHDCDIIIR